MKCPDCGSQVRILAPASNAMYCLDCDWDNLEPLNFAEKTLPIDAEWYLKSQLTAYRKWQKADFSQVEPDWGGSYEGAYTYDGFYYHRSTVERHEDTLFFQRRIHRWRTPQRPVPEQERIDELAWTLCIRGDELIRNGWTYEMIDKLTPYRNRKWRKKRVFRLCDLKAVSETLWIRPPADWTEKDFTRRVFGLYTAGITPKKIAKIMTAGGFGKVSPKMVKRALYPEVYTEKERPDTHTKRL